MSRTFYQQCKNRLENLPEFGNSYEDILIELNKLYQLALGGVIQEKVHMREGVVEVVEKYPELAHSILKTKLGIIRDIQNMTSKEQEEVDINLAISVVPLELEIGKAKHKGIDKSADYSVDI